ncbi:nuclear transport factor 2 family protein [Parahaliea mediterranea]|uniref:Nuclear transport factor 2 family protein n=1 Tax=Parahaliea mediterranea TaxID=651086 RepID=A0A939DIV4_9GAMM|nr:nuclear transport factor 2 family protein [Parahaliea mediterranea]MBN7798909.1 nuclear transport factor 2 family protein [Parahaliea mediterranea]
MSDPSPLDPRLEALLDKQAITELVYAYCNAADRHDNDKMRSLYHEDAIDEHGQFFQGPAMEFIDALPGIQENMLILHHNVTTLNIVLDGDRAEGEVYILAFHQVAVDGGAMDVLIGGRYFDKYEKRDGVWKYTHRAVVADWVKVDPETTVDLEHPMIEGSRIGTPGQADPSYSFFEIFNWGKGPHQYR